MSDMYTKARLEQTPLEAATWTKEESAPYPPAVRLTQAAMFALGERTGLGLYGLTLILAAAFLAASAWYFLQTRWYLFPLLYLNFAFFADRFVYVQDGSYLVMLACVMAALLLARGGRRRIATLLIAVATAMKLLPISGTSAYGKPSTVLFDRMPGLASSASAAAISASQGGAAVSCVAMLIATFGNDAACVGRTSPRSVRFISAADSRPRARWSRCGFVR